MQSLLQPLDLELDSTAWNLWSILSYMSLTPRVEVVYTDYQNESTKEDKTGTTFPIRIKY